MHSVDWLLEERGLIGGNETSRGENVQHSRHHVNNKRNNKNCFRTKKNIRKLGKINQKPVNKIKKDYQKLVFFSKIKLNYCFFFKQ